MKFLKHKIISIASLIAFMAPSLSSCSDEPDSENFYTFTGEMASDYLKNREQYSSSFISTHPAPALFIFLTGHPAFKSTISAPAFSAFSCCFATPWHAHTW